MRNKAILFVSILAGAGACGPQAELAGDESAIINGVEDTSAAHQAVVMLRSTTGRCSGTLIAPTVVITAAHCLAGGEPRRSTDPPMEAGLSARAPARRELRMPFHRTRAKARRASVSGAP